MGGVWRTGTREEVECATRGEMERRHSFSIRSLSLTFVDIENGVLKAVCSLLIRRMRSILWGEIVPI